MKSNLFENYRSLFLLSLSLLYPSMALALEGPPAQLAAKQILSELNGPDAAASIRGTTQLWIDVVLQTPKDDPAFASLANDLQASDLQAKLETSGFKVMDPAKKSWARGLRPTLEIMVLRAPANYLGSKTGFYLVMASALQQLRPKGGSTDINLTTWCRTGDPIPFSGDSHKDVDAIRASARDLVRAFIDAAEGVQAVTAAPSATDADAKP